jgi:hypothetical protein
MPGFLQSLPLSTRRERGHLRVGLCVALVAGACESSGPRVYTARAYRADATCLEAYTAIGRVEANDLGASCTPVCLLLGDGVYVSTVCPPYPSIAALTDPATSPDCGAALELLDAEVFCEDSGVGDATGDAGGDPGSAPADAASE